MSSNVVSLHNMKKCHWILFMSILFCFGFSLHSHRVSWGCFHYAFTFMWCTSNWRTLSRVVYTTKDLTCLKQWYVLWYNDILSASVTATLAPVTIIAWDSFVKWLTFYIFTAMYKSSSFLTDICFYQSFSFSQFSLHELLFHCGFNFHYN